MGPGQLCVATLCDGLFLFQVECHPYLAQNELIAHCQARGLEVTAYSPLGSSDRAWRDPEEPVLLEEPVVLALAEKYGRSPAQILLRCVVFLGEGAVVEEKTFGVGRQKLGSFFEGWDVCIPGGQVLQELWGSCVEDNVLLGI